MNESMLDRLVSMENRYEELGHMLMDPDIGTDNKIITDVTKEQASLQAAFVLFRSACTMFRPPALPPPARAAPAGARRRKRRSHPPR